MSVTIPSDWRSVSTEWCRDLLNSTIVMLTGDLTSSFSASATLGKQKTPRVGTDEGNAEKDQMQAKKRKLEQFMDHAVRVGRAAFRVRARLGRRSATGVA